MRSFEEFQEPRGQAALSWVAEQNKQTVDALHAHATFEETAARTFSMISSKEKIPWPSLTRDGRYRNFWKDDNHPRGILRETDAASYRTNQPQWTTILDVDALSQAEQHKWAYAGMIGREMHGRIYSLVMLSDNGSDAHAVREFDLSTRQFVANGFQIPIAKNSVAWWDPNSLLAATDFGDDTLTDSDNPSSVRLLARGQALEDAPVLFSIDRSHIGVDILSFKTASTEVLFYVDVIDVYHSAFHFVSPTNPSQYVRLPIPENAEIKDVFNNLAIFTLRSDWQMDANTAFKMNDVLALDLEKFARDPRAALHELGVQLIFRPGHRCAIESIDSNAQCIFIETLNNINGELIALRPTADSFVVEKIPLIENGAIDVVSLSCQHDEVIISCESFLTPPTLFSYHSRTKTLEKLKEGRHIFNANLFQVTQHEAVSKDGTRVPYHMIAPRNFSRDGTNPTVLHGYGGFEISLTPEYLGLDGMHLLEKGYIYVQANIRGGGEFGADWARMGRKEFKQNSFDDFIAVAMDLVNRQITSPPFLAIKGGSNGGLLVGACAIQRPDLFGAVISEVPLLDMLRYHTFSTDCDALDEYGDPEDAQMRIILERYSPLQNVRRDVSYPIMFIQTATNDSRVHPYHARIMTQTLQLLGNKVYFYEESDGGHSGNADLHQTSSNIARDYVFLHRHLLEPALIRQRELAQQRAREPQRLFAQIGVLPQRRERENDSASLQLG